jgi:hypothetical protein
MKKVILLCIAIVCTNMGFAEVIEIKSSDRYKENLNSVEGTFRSPYQSKFPYVCYDKRLKIISEGTYYLSYEGCMRINTSCQSTGRVHFGKYPNDAKAYEALQRCENSRPRFVD